MTKKKKRSKRYDRAKLEKLLEAQIEKSKPKSFKESTMSIVSKAATLAYNAADKLAKAVVNIWKKAMPHLKEASASASPFLGGFAAGYLGVMALAAAITQPGMFFILLGAAVVSSTFAFGVCEVCDLA